MILDIRSCDDIFTVAALEIDKEALILPVLIDALSVREMIVIAVAACLFAREGAAATFLPMGLSLFVLEGLGAYVAYEKTVVEGLHDEPVYVLANVLLSSTVRAGLITLCPGSDAGATAELIALLAFLRVFNDLKADRAREILV